VKVIKKTDEYAIYQRRDNRYAVKNAEGRWVNGSQKVAILVENELINAVVPENSEELSEIESNTEAGDQATNVDSEDLGDEASNESNVEPEPEDVPDSGAEATPDNSEENSDQE